MRSISFPSVLASLACVGLLTSCGGGSGGGAQQEEPVVEAPVVEAPVVEAPVVFVQSIPASQERIIPTDEARPYRSDSQYAAVLKDCALAMPDDICKLEVLPYIGQSGRIPTTEDVMQRVVVSHDWMGARFEQMLNRMPPDMLELFAPVTSILIGSDVRPSSYSPRGASIQLDPRYFWLSVPEKRTISTSSDFRTGFGSALRFRAYWRLAKGNSYAVPFSSLLDDNEREIDDLDIDLAELLYHELAHANDSIQYDDLPGVSGSMTPLEAANVLEDTQVWSELYNDFQLTAQSSYLYRLARVRYRDEEPTEFDASVLGEFVGAEMGNEGKMEFYGYSTVYEDVATLFASAMIKYHYDVDTHVGFVNKQENDQGGSCDDQVVWGSRNRLAGSLVAPRAQFVVDKILRPSANRDQFFASQLGTETSLRVGAGWCDSVSNDVQLAKQPQTYRVPRELGAR